MFRSGKKFFSAILVIILIGNGISFAQHTRNNSVRRDLQSDWLIYDKDRNALVPYFTSIHGNQKLIHFYIYPANYRRSELTMVLPERTGIFINNDLVDFQSRAKTISYRLDSLSRRYNQDSILFSIYSSSGLNRMVSQIITSNPIKESQVSRTDYLPIKYVDKPVVFEFVKLAILIILTLYAFLLNSGRKTFIAYHNIKKTFSRISTDEFLNRSPGLTRVDIFYLLGVSIIMSFIIIFIVFHRVDPNAIFEIDGLGPFFVVWVVLFPLLFLWYLLRILFISLFSDLFKIREYKTIHIYEMLRITTFFISLFFLFVLGGIFLFQVDIEKIGIILAELVFWFCIFRMIIIFLKFLNSASYKKLYLFTYLCIAELFPIVIGLKYLLKSSFIQYII